MNRGLSGRPLILLGTGGHGRVVAELATVCGGRLLGVCDPALSREGVAVWRGIPVLGGDEYLETVNTCDVWLLNGVGMMPGKSARRSVYQRMSQSGFQFPALVHPAAWVSDSATLEAGAQIMAGAVVQAGATIGYDSIINTGSTVDHDSVVGRHCHIAPGATLCGDVEVGDQAFVGAGATVIQGVTIGPDTLIRAGTVITRNVP